VNKPALFSEIKKGRPFKTASFFIKEKNGRMSFLQHLHSFSKAL